MKVYVVTTTYKGKVCGVEVFWRREEAASLMMRKSLRHMSRRKMQSLDGRQDTAKARETLEGANGDIYQVRYGDVVSELFVREI